MLNDNGGVIDDLIAYKLENGYRLVVNCATRGEDLKWISEKAKNYSVQMEERDDLSMVAIQGPKSSEVLSNCPAPIVRELESKKKQQGVYGNDMFATKTGYTGENGFEVILPHALAVGLWRNAIKAGAQPIGLGARDTLRLEAGLCLYGHDLNEKTNPIEANLKWAIAKRRREEGGFNGWEKLKDLIANGSDKKRVGILPEGRIIARENTKVFSEQDEEIGLITSGTFGPSVNASVAMGYINSKFTEIGTKIQLEVRGKKHGGKVSELPFFKKSYVK